MEKHELAVTYSCLSQPRSSEAEALNVFSGNYGDPYIQEMIELGLAGKSIEYLKGQINFLLGNGLFKGNPAHVLGNIIFTLAAKQNRNRFVELLCADDKHLEFIEGASYLHDNGFKKFVLLQTPLYKVRLHIWDTVVDKLPQENVHDHRWPFASVMLTGYFASKIYKVTERGDEERFAYQYSPVIDGKYNLRNTGMATLQESIPLVIKKDNGYYMPPETLHRVVYDGKERAMTLVITGVPVNDNCRLFAKSELKEEETAVERMNKSAIRNTIYELKYL